MLHCLFFVYIESGMLGIYPEILAEILTILLLPTRSEGVG